MNNQYDSILEALADLNTKGYSQNFSLTPQGLYCPLTQQIFTADQLQIVEFHRFEGDSNMEDMAILYVIQSSSDCKGVLIDAFGTYGDSELGKFLKAIPKQ